MFKLLLPLCLLFSINSYAETDKLKLQTDILTANALTLVATSPPSDQFENLTPIIIHSGVVNIQFLSNPSLESEQALKELLIDKNNNLIINKEGVVINVYRYKNAVKVLTFLPSEYYKECCLNQ